MLDLTHLSVDSWTSYLIALVAPALDAVFPIVPSETAIITLGVATAGSTDPRIFLLVSLAALGAFAGDNLCYFIGRRFGPWVDRRFFSSEKGRRRRSWAEEKLQRFGVGLILVCRFIPGGRTAVCLICGVTAYPRRMFVPATAASAVVWACYAFFLGRIGGKAFQNSPWIGLALALAVAFVVSGIVEGVRRTVRWIGARRSRASELSEPG